MASEPGKRIELVTTPTKGNQESGRVGLGLIAGLVLGRKSLLAAATGAEQFELAVGHFVATVLVAVAGSLILGVAYDRSTANVSAAEDEDEQEDEPSASSPDRKSTNALAEASSAELPATTS